MAKYDSNLSLGQNAAKGVDITEPNPPEEITISDDLDFIIPDDLWEEISCYLASKYGNGKFPQSYGLEIVVSDIDWEEK